MVQMSSGEAEEKWPDGCNLHLWLNNWPGGGGSLYQCPVFGCSLKYKTPGWLAHGLSVPNNPITRGGHYR
jgi:hypothetical protein